MFLKRYLLLQFFIFLLWMSAPATAAKLINLRHQAPSSLLPTLQADSKDQLKLQEQSRQLDFKQTLHLRLQQTYANYPIWGAQVVLHVPKAKQQDLAEPWTQMLAPAHQASMNGSIYQALTEELKQQPASEQAEKAFTQVFSPQPQAVVSDKKVELMVYVDAKAKAHWVYYIQYLLKPFKGLPSKPCYLVDAFTFQVYRSWDKIQTEGAGLKASGGGFGGNKKTGQFIYDGLSSHYPVLSIKRNNQLHRCYLFNKDVQVLDASKYDSVVQFNCRAPDPLHNNVFWDGALDAVNEAYSPANDALFVGKIIKELYQEWYKLPVLTRAGKPMLLVMRVHEDLENAYWDGEQMTFGDGEDFFYPLVSLGVGAHEVSHGFTEQHSNLVYQEESGGLNESFSDMAAQAAEFYVGGKNTWQIGAEILKENNKALRYMDHPSRDCERVMPGEDCSIEQVKAYHYGLNVHLSSGIFNRVFYLIATAPGWDTKKAFDIMVQANMHYWTPTVDFEEAACGVMSAVKDYAYPSTAVVQAFMQVGIDVRQC